MGIFDREIGILESYYSTRPKKAQVTVQTLPHRFWAKVEKTPECWEWTGVQNGRGYGLVAVPSGTDRAHRVSWMMEYGLIPDGMHVLHRCDNRSCVRPTHLFLGTNDDNIQDRVSKGRSTGRPKGSTHHHCGCKERLEADNVRLVALAEGFLNG